MFRYGDLVGTGKQVVQPGPLTGHQGRLEEHELEAVRGVKVGKEKSDEPTVDGRSPAPAVISETP